MKKNKIFKITLLTLASVMVACGDVTPSITPSTGNSDIPTTSTNPTTTATPTTNTPTTNTQTTPDEYTKLTVS